MGCFRDVAEAIDVEKSKFCQKYIVCQEINLVNIHVMLKYSTWNLQYSNKTKNDFQTKIRAFL